MKEPATFATRRTLLCAFPSAAAPGFFGPWQLPRTSHVRFATDSEPVLLRRSSEGRALSKARLDTAEEFFAGVEEGRIRSRGMLLYNAGIASQLALSAHLLDVGFPDDWNARNLGLNVARSLACANATGLCCDDPQMIHFAERLSPYGKWRFADITGVSDFPLTDDQVRLLTRQLIDRTRDVTGHPRHSRT